MKCSINAIQHFISCVGWQTCIQNTIESKI